MGLVDRVKNILVQPKQEWVVISGESTTVQDLYKNYIAPLAAIGPVAGIIGVSIVGIGLPAGTYRVPILTSTLSAIINYVLALAAVYILAMVIDYLAPTFSGEKDMDRLSSLQHIPGPPPGLRASSLSFRSWPFYRSWGSTAFICSTREFPSS